MSKLHAAGSGALALAALIPPPGMAQSYDVANETELGAAVQAANASAGASATINLTGGFTGQGIPAVAKPITFDLHGFSMTGTYTPGTLTTSGTITLTGPAGAGLLTLSGAGAIRGADAGPAAATNGGIGLFLNTSAALVNATTIVGGAGGGAGGSGGAGARLLNNSTLVNSGTIAGGQGLAGGGGQGAQLSSGALTNDGIIRGGDSASGNGGPGVLFRAPGGPSVLTNNAGGIIRGGTGTVLGGTGIDVRAGVGQIINAGTVEGGNGGVAVSSNAAPIDLVNSGTIRAGAGQANAIGFTTPGAASALTLELRAGSVIAGNVVGNAAQPNDMLRLGGTANASFDAAAIGAAAQYRNFDQFEKTGASTWTLTGATTATTGWTIGGGTLAVADDASLGDAAGALTINGGALATTASTTSARALVLAGAATLDSAAATTHTVDGAITGAGALAKSGTGTLTLTANSAAYSGAVDVLAGTLRVNGVLGDASSTVAVRAGATLGGSGTLGGNVGVANGAVLAPGNSPGTLTINGNLTLAPAAVSRFELGQANVAGGALNDLVNVGGNLVLDGTLAVTRAAGGSFDPGVYRLFNYGGALTNNGLQVASLPGANEGYIQTSVAQQVNLVNTGPATPAVPPAPLNFWDGAAGHANGAIDGGAGVWQSGAGNANWTGSTGAANGAYQDAAFAIFGGAPGVVTVDAGAGAVTASGLQFASDGYRVAGASVALTAPRSVIRVGDGTAAGAAYRATIDAALTGAGGLAKADGGTLTLTGANTYAGGTALEQGALRVARDANLGAAAGALAFNGGALETTADFGSGRAVALTGAGAIATDAGTTLTLTGALAGAGALTKRGAGTLVLAGDGASFAGATSVAGGTLLVNGKLGGATGVVAGGTLGGTGTLAGNVNLTGGVLAPGAGGAGTLTVGGNLVLGAGARIAYDAGAANTVGGALNDLIDVGGDLTLGGTLDVAVTPGGAFGVGIYRLANYGGTLTDNGLALGALPAGALVSVQTAVAHQVNLVNAAPPSTPAAPGAGGLEFWDGAAKPGANGAIDGGAGVWQSGAGNTHWTDAAGAVNAGYRDGGFAIFTGAAGSVTIDNSRGAVAASGLQFARDGYALGGGALTLAGAQAAIRVGDGTAAGAGYTASVDAELAGGAQLVKLDLGTLALTGNNSYTGGTLIRQGQLRIAADANLGAAGGRLTLDGGTLATAATLASGRAVTVAGAGAIAPAAGTSLTLSGAIDGAGALTKAGAGTLRLTGDGGRYTGAATLAAGTLAVDGRLGGSLAVAAGARLEGGGVVGALANAGVVAPGGERFGTLTAAGYTGAGGRLEIKAELGGDNSRADLLAVTGATAGATVVGVRNLGGLGAATVNGIKIIDVAGASAGSFTLDGNYTFRGEPALIAGAYGYRLRQNGVATPADGDWYLRSSLIDAPVQVVVPDPAVAPGPAEPAGAPLYQPGVPVYEAYGQTLLALNDVGTMRQRVGNRQWPAAAGGRPSAAWGRVQSERARPNAAFSASGAGLRVDTSKLEVGVERQLGGHGDNTLVLGLLGSVGQANADVGSVFGNGAIDTKAYGAGATLSWLGADGGYVDARAQASWFDSKLTSSVLGTLADGNDGHGQAYSVEAGRRWPAGAALSLTPQVQLVYSKVGFSRFTGPAGVAVRAGRDDSLTTRAGLALDRQTGAGHLYGIANLRREWRAGTVADVSGTPIARRNHRLWGELGMGASTMVDERCFLYAEVAANTAVRDFGKSYGFKGEVSLRLAF
ncbi:outer membrane autotransporter protein [Duganella sp. 1411]|uniref:autotransporter outer membrane beta-barrel domain-containing protein n=1 Tax=Duganella sp. 1411 TaxID=2806572 RepID=UPI001AE15A30|nr:autotransporter outer membrane beta-barrel domain-containing protein [Duganella sp. 1411]MBP1206605.1 outer membrane autotransporter protein [Duganella sp. 1411]